jgi:hypothetical protein
MKVWAVSIGLVGLVDLSGAALAGDPSQADFETCNSEAQAMVAAAPRPAVEDTTVTDPREQPSQYPTGSRPTGEVSQPTVPGTGHATPTAVERSDARPEEATSAAREPSAVAGAMAGLRGLHSMTGEVTSVDARTGMVALKTDVGTLDLHFPPAALRDVRKRDELKVRAAARFG